MLTGNRCGTRGGPGHNVLRVDPATHAVTVLAHNAAMNLPNDLAIAPDGTLYASDPNWKAGTGQLWRIDRDGRSVYVTEVDTAGLVRFRVDRPGLEWARWGR